MINDTPLIICGSGNSIPFCSYCGLDEQLQKLVDNNVTFGLNYFDYFTETNTTSTIFVDTPFYNDNESWLKEIPLIIGKENCKIKEHLYNTIFLPSGRYFFNEESLDINYKKCLACNFKIQNTDIQKKCLKCNALLWQIGIYHHHNCGLFALTLGIALGFKKIYLLGYDCTEINGKTHFYQDLIIDKKKFRGVGRNNNAKKDYRTCTYNNIQKINELWFAPYKDLKGVEIINVSPNSVIDIFPKITYDEFYKQLRNEQVNQEQIRKEIRNYIFCKIL